ncbi:MAG TPA: UDP-N-acetylmuramoyl-L-alanyl-D-glutamate--2,6-diaminopimelate ligase [Vicinamibacterales bacterium]|nr:UDP-N-acetylmuramoyl-L-alanyl-D-glutamate--2,6-diaminopimelate ligase [Vicinamibacterales bacterium]
MTVEQLLRALRRLVAFDERGLSWGHPELQQTCTGVTHDSRHVTAGTVFVALRGLKMDGAVFAPQAIAAGAAVIVSESAAQGTPDAAWITVPDARLALAYLAAEFNGHPSQQMRVVGITGTNGKTTTAYLVSAILEAAGIKCGLMGTVLYRIGDQEFEATRTTPEAPEVQGFMKEMLTSGCRACVMEVSSHALALRRVDGIRFAAGIFTNLTRDHLDFHTNMEDYFTAKRRLFEMLPDDAPAAINIDDPRGAALLDVVKRPVTYGLTKSADVSPGSLSYSLEGLQFDVRSRRGPIRVRSRLVGRPNVYNILAAIATTSALDVPTEAIEQGLERLAGVPGRFEVASSPADDVTVVVDYAHTDDALRNLLETARPLARRRLITVFGAGGDRDKTKRPLMGMVAARLSDIVVITSDNPRSEDPNRIIEEVKRGADAETRQSRAEVLTRPDRREAILHAVGMADPGDVVLVAGKGHEKYQEIGGQTFAFDDVEVAREALASRRLNSRAG